MFWRHRQHTDPLWQREDYCFINERHCFLLVLHYSSTVHNAKPLPIVEIRQNRAVFDEYGHCWPLIDNIWMFTEKRGNFGDCCDDGQYGDKDEVKRVGEWSMCSYTFGYFCILKEEDIWNVFCRKELSNGVPNMPAGNDRCAAKSEHRPCATKNV
jgi:hypothetical protein